MNDADSVFDGVVQRSGHSSNASSFSGTIGRHLWSYSFAETGGNDDDALQQNFRQRPLLCGRQYLSRTGSRSFSRISIERRCDTRASMLLCFRGSVVPIVFSAT